MVITLCQWTECPSTPIITVYGERERCVVNVMDRPIRPAPPKPTARKGDPVNAKFEDRAKEMLRDAMRQRGVTIEQLTERLSAIGVEMSAGGVANKISRGGFSAAFLMQCFEALKVDLVQVPR